MLSPYILEITYTTIDSHRQVRDDQLQSKQHTFNNRSPYAQRTLQLSRVQGNTVFGSS